MINTKAIEKLIEANSKIYSFIDALGDIGLSVYGRNDFVLDVATSRIVDAISILLELSKGESEWFREFMFDETMTTGRVMEWYGHTLKYRKELERFNQLKAEKSKFKELIEASIDGVKETEVTE